MEFAANGLAGTRVEAIAERAEINKRMIYQYFGNKELLYQAVLEKVYRDVWDAEAALNLDQLPPREAVVALVTFVWTYYLEHPEFITILNSENQLKAAHFRKSSLLREGATIQGHSSMTSCGAERPMARFVPGSIRSSWV